MTLKIPFADSSGSFVNGVEYGRIWAKMEAGIAVVGNCGFPVHLTNKRALELLSKAYGYSCVWGIEYFGEWIEFTATSKLGQN